MPTLEPTPAAEDRTTMEFRRWAYITILTGGLIGIIFSWAFNPAPDPLMRLANPLYLLINSVLLAMAVNRKQDVRLIDRLGFGYAMFALAVQIGSLYMQRTSLNGLWQTFHTVQQVTISSLLLAHILFKPRQANWVNTLVVLSVSGLIAPAMFAITDDGPSAWGKFLIFGVIFGAFLNVLTLSQDQLARERILSTTDALTGAANRRKVATELDLALETGVSVILYDLDYFKVVNDTYGHTIGDSVLRESTQVARDAILGFGAARATLGRWGGEEFLIVLPSMPLELADQLAERIRERFAAHHFAVPITITASFGVAARLEGESAGQLVRRADQALYQAKFSGRNMVWVSLRHHTSGLLEVN